MIQTLAEARQRVQEVIASAATMTQPDWSDDDNVEFVPGDSNVFVREMRFGRRRVVVDGHEHNFSHLTYCSAGALLVERLDDAGSVVGWAILTAGMSAPFINIAAGVRHRISALELPSMGHCIYAHRDPQGQLVQRYEGWRPAYV